MTLGVPMGVPPIRYETAYIYGGTGTCASASQQKIGPHSVNTCDSATTTGTSNAKPST